MPDKTDKTPRRRGPAGRMCWVCGLPSGGFDRWTHGHLCLFHHQQANELYLRLHPKQHKPGEKPKKEPYIKPVVRSNGLRFDQRGRAS